VGLKEVTLAGLKLQECNIDLIYSSDILRTKQTSEIVASILGISEIKFNQKLRDLNWGILQVVLKKMP
jgi:broad specificity phosphatase PhoE